MKTLLKKTIKYGLYPLLLSLVIVIITLAVNQQMNYKIVSGLTNLGLIIILILIEIIFPLSDQWKMTSRDLWRDIKYVLLNVPAIALANALVSIFAIYFGENFTGYFSGLPILPSVIGYLVIFEFLQYWYHRLSHEGRGKLGRFFWRVHLAHHLPEKVYVVMHAVFNPLNGFIAAIIIQVPILLLGISPEAAFAATLFIGLQGIVSHFNVDIKAGFFNYIFIGTETHRYHHSTFIEEAKNFGVAITLWDLVFGTFLYRPTPPAKLGLEDPSGHPRSENVFEVIRLPFNKS